MSMPPGGSATGIRVIPPVIVLAALVLGFLADWLWPIGLGGTNLQTLLGIALVVAAIGTAALSIAAFRRRDVKFDVRRVPERLVTDGPFVFSRNPGYLALIAFGVGIGLAFDNPWIFVALVPAALILHFHVVLIEEDLLEKRFGEEYLTYRQSVRRWL